MAVRLYVNTHLRLVKALNYVVYYLFTALSRGLSTIMKLGELDVFTEVMRLYQQNYDGIGLMCDYIVKALGYFEYARASTSPSSYKHLETTKQLKSVETKQYDQVLG